MKPSRVYGYDPYNTLTAVTIAARVVTHYHGPLTSVAYRDHRGWDFAPGVATEKSKTYSASVRKLGVI